MASLNDHPDDSHASLTVSYLHYLRMAWRRKSLIALGGVIGLLIGTLYYVQKTPLYESNAQVLIVNKRPDTGMGSSMHLSHFEDYVSTHRVLVRSPLIVERAIEKHRLGALECFRDIDDDLTTELIERLSVHRSVKESGSVQNSILSLSFQGTIPDECGIVVNAVVSSYKEFLDETYRNMSDDTMKLVADARDTLTKDLAAKEEEYRRFREKSPLLWRGKEEINPLYERLQKIESQRSRLLLRKAELQGRLTTVETAVQENRPRQEIIAIISDLVHQPEPAEPGSEKSTTLDAQLLPLLLEEQTLLGDYGRNHPHIVSVRKRMEATRHFFAMPTASYSFSTSSGKTDEPAPSEDLIALYTRYLKHELERIGRQQKTLTALYENEHESAHKITSDELRDEQLRSGITRTQELYDGIVKRLQDVGLAKDYGGFEARPIAAAGVGEKVSPKAATVFPVALFLGVLGGLGMASLAEISDKRFRTPDEVRRRLGLPVVGHIPFRSPKPEDLQKVADGQMTIDPMICTYHEPRSGGAEAYRGLRTALYFSTLGEGHKSIQITSPNMGEGKSTISANLAVSIAQTGKRVILIDADLRRPRQHKIFGVSSAIGLAGVISHEAELEDAIQVTDIPGLSVLPCGPTPHNPAELLTSPRFQEMLAVIQEKYDYVLLDSAPLLAVSDPCAIAPRVDGVLLIISVSKHGGAEAQRAKEILNSLEANVLGVVVNRVQDAASGYGKGYGDGYGYQNYGYAEAYQQDTNGESGHIENGSRL